MNWMESNGASLRYEIDGDNDQVLLLVHELGGTLESWDETLPALRQNFRVLRYDQRGFGLSEKPASPLTLDVLADDIAGMLDALDISAPCHVAGTAIGGAIALGFAARYPERVAKLVVTSPATGASEASRPNTLNRAETVERDGMRPVCQSSLDRSYPETLRANRARFEKYRLMWLSNSPNGFAAINRMLAGMNMDADFDKIQCPTLVISGRNDLLRPPETIEPIARAIANAQYVETDAGHFLAVQNPELFLEHVLPFLAAT